MVTAVSLAPSSFINGPTYANAKACREVTAIVLTVIISMSSIIISVNAVVACVDCVALWNTYTKAQGDCMAASTEPMLKMKAINMAIVSGMFSTKDQTIPYGTTSLAPLTSSAICPTALYRIVDRMATFCPTNAESPAVGQLPVWSITCPSASPTVVFGVTRTQSATHTGIKAKT